jgi:hypothetical protein
MIDFDTLFCGDRGDISQRLLDKLLLRKRAIIESINHPLNNIQQIEHSRHPRLPSPRP